MSRSLHDKVDLGREAMKRHAWEEARGFLAEADAEGSLDAEGLRQLGKAEDWCGNLRGCIDAFERSYAGFVSSGNKRAAASVALMLRHQCVNGLQDMAAARGWVQRAEHLLEGEPECIELGFLWRMQGRRAFGEGKHDEGRELLLKAIDLANRLGEPNLMAMSLSWLGVQLSVNGLSEEAFPYLDEACTAAVGGELGPWATGIVYCNTISSYREAGEFDVAGKWTHTAGRWCERESINGFPGICRVHRAEFMRLRGAWVNADQEATRAIGELEGSAPGFAGAAHYEVGLIRLRMGDAAGAEAAFAHAHDLGVDPQPGAALLLAMQGEPEAALNSLATSIAARDFGILDEMHCLVTQVDIACELRRLELAQSAVERLETLATGQRGLGMQVLAVQARGTLQLSRGEAEAGATLRRAQRLWQEIDAPYEVAQVRLLLARALRSSGDSAAARREIEAAHGAFERLGAIPDAARAKRQLEEPAASPTVAQRTLFFSDIVGSTQLIEAIGDGAWHDLVAWLDGSLRQCFVTHGGEEVDHAGDGFFVAFPDSKSALECAVEIQRKLADHRREHGFAPKIRIGVHATSANQSGGSYRGRGVHEASRIASLAGPDEILASRETVPPGFIVSDPREVSVKGIAKPVEVVRIDWTR
jgi:class 3 adenylate cyclase